MEVRVCSGCKKEALCRRVGGARWQCGTCDRAVPVEVLPIKADLLVDDAWSFALGTTAKVYTLLLLLALLPGCLWTQDLRGFAPALPQPLNPPVIAWLDSARRQIAADYPDGHLEQAVLLLQRQGAAQAEKMGCSRWHTEVTTATQGPPVPPPRGPTHDDGASPSTVVTHVAGLLTCDSTAPDATTEPAR